MKPKFIERPAFKIAGLAKNFSMENMHEIPALWESFLSKLPQLKDRRGEFLFGVVHNDLTEAELEEFEFGYIAGAEVKSISDLPMGFSGREIPAAKYAVFKHDGGTEKLQDTWGFIYGKWLPGSGHEEADTPCFEQYSGKGGQQIEVWFPIR